MTNIQTLLSEYGESHQNKTNKLVHWICVPIIFFTLVGLFYSVKLPFYLLPDIQLNLAHIISIAAMVYYFKLSKPLAVGLLIFLTICIWLCYVIEESELTLWKVSLLVFVLAWIGQFWGHKIEGKKPSFLKDIQFLMIGPAWLLSFIYEKLEIKI